MEDRGTVVYRGRQRSPGMDRSNSLKWVGGASLVRPTYLKGVLMVACQRSTINDRSDYSISVAVCLKFI